MKKSYILLFLLFTFALLCSCGDEPSDQSKNELFPTPYMGWYESVEKIKSKAKGEIDYEETEPNYYGESSIQYNIGNGIKCRYTFYNGKLDFVYIDLPYEFRASHVIKEYLDSKYKYLRKWTSSEEKGYDYTTKDGQTYIEFFQQGCELSVCYFDINNPRYFYIQE